ncbi:MAG: hypothetical protein KH135_01530 [Firmicutes bacterium]|nr:hypothetical protein [Bacillota bacterium]
MVARYPYYLGGSSFVPSTKENAYSVERGTEIFQCSSGSTCPRAYETKEYIGIPYISDYGYAARENCEVSTLWQYGDNENCSRDGNWLLLSDALCFITPRSDLASSVFHIYTNGYIGRDLSTKAQCRVAPVLYLEEQVRIVSGDGTIQNPYIFEK